MGLKLENVVPWGRSLQEYMQMFHLSERDLQLAILDCASGPASFNSEMTAKGYKVISCDPLYQFTAEEIAKRIQETYPTVMAGVQANQNQFVWRDIQSPEQLGEVRMAAMLKFLEDFPSGLQAGRYLPHALPVLPFQTSQFDLALCSHFLFTYSDQLSADFHLKSIGEMCRVAKEVRIFPLLVNMTGELSPLLQPVISELQKRGCQVEIRQVAYEFQQGGNQLLQVRLFVQNAELMP